VPLSFLEGGEAMTDKPTDKPNVYINPKAPTWLKRMLLEQVFRDANVVSAEKLQAKLDKAINGKE
jgi:hypothetical protein